MNATRSFAMAALTVAAGAALAQGAATTAASTVPAAAPGLSRSEVLADLALWRRAGMDAFSDVEGADLSAPDAVRRMAAYRQLRDGTAYAVEVQHVAQQRGEAVDPTAAGRPTMQSAR